MYGEPGYHLHLSAFVHLPHSFLTFGFSFQNLLELCAYLKDRWLDCSCLCHFSSSLTFICCIWYSAVTQLFSLQWNASGYMPRNDLQTALWGLHVYSRCDSYQICSTYNCKYVFIAASSAKTLPDSKANLCVSILAHILALRVLLLFCSVRILVRDGFILLSFGSLCLQELVEATFAKVRPWIFTLVQHSREAMEKTM